MNTITLSTHTVKHIRSAFSTARIHYAKHKQLVKVKQYLNAQEEVISEGLTHEEAGQVRYLFSLGRPGRTHKDADAFLHYGAQRCNDVLNARKPSVGLPVLSSDVDPKQAAGRAERSPDLMPAYEAWIKRCVAHSVPLIPYKCPECQYPLFTRHAPQFDRWDSTAMCPQCHKLYVKITEGDTVTVLRMPS